MEIWEHQLQAINSISKGITNALKRKEAEECVRREFCPDCKGYGFEGEGCIVEECEIFREEVEQTLKDWATVPD